MSIRIPRTSAILLSPILLGLAAHAAAADGPTIEQRLEELDQEIRILKRKAEIAAEEAAAKAKAGSPAVTANAKDGFSIISADKSWKLRISGLLAVDSRQFISDDHPGRQNSFYLRYFRPSFNVALGSLAEVVFVPEFAGSATSVDNGYIDLKAVPGVTIRAGKFVQPLGLERLHSAANLSFGERSLASNLTANRDIGVQASADYLGGQIGWSLGVFNGSIDNGNPTLTGETSNGTTSTKSNGTFNSADGKDVVGRIAAKPFAWLDSAWLGNLELGFSAGFGDEDGAAGAVYVSPGQQSLNAYRANVLADGHRLRLNPQLKWYANQFSLLGEYVLSRQRLQAPGGARTASNRGWYLSLGWVVTGEDASWRGVSPAADFNPAAGTWGALELLARIHRLELDRSGFSSGINAQDGAAWTDPWQSVRSATAYGVAAQWYWSRNVKLLNAYERTDFRDGAGSNRATLTDRETEHVLLTRLQVSY